MAKSIQIRDVPDKVHRALRVRAAEAGVSLSDYLLRELTRLASRPLAVETLLRGVRSGRVTRTDILTSLDEGRANR